MKHKKVRIYVNGKGFTDVASSVFSKLINNDILKTFTLTALKKGAEVGGDKVGSFVANKITSKVLPAEQEKKEIRTIIEQLEEKVRSEINNYTPQTGKGYKIIR
jgi:hypothetical protein